MEMVTTFTYKPSVYVCVLLSGRESDASRTSGVADVDVSDLFIIYQHYYRQYGSK